MKKRSFTLIELLVVIALIGLLASIILVSLKGTTKKAKIAKGLEFSQSIQHALGSESVGIWSFDDCPVGTANDASGYGNNGTITGASCTDDTPHKLVGPGQGKYALSFNGVGDYVEAPDSNSLDLSSQVTITAWINPSFTSAWNRIVAKSHTSNTSPYTMYGLLFDNANHIRLEIATNGLQNAVNGVTTIPLNTWTFVAGTYDGSTMKVYVNGNLDNSTALTGAIDTNNMPLSIGRSGFGSDYFNGTIDEVRIYSQALSLGEIQKHYAEGLERHKDLALQEP